MYIYTSRPLACALETPWPSEPIEPAERRRASKGASKVRATHESVTAHVDGGAAAGGTARGRERDRRRRIHEAVVRDVGGEILPVERDFERSSRRGG